MRLKALIGIAATTAVLALSPVAGAQTKSTQVRGHVNKQGEYVAPHRRTTPNDRVNDNWSTKGNYNPYTGKEGTKPRGPK